MGSIFRFGYPFEASFILESPALERKKEIISWGVVFRKVSLMMVSSRSSISSFRLTSLM